MDLRISSVLKLVLPSIGVKTQKGPSKITSPTLLSCANESQKTLFLLFSRPGAYFLMGEPIFVSVFNPDNIPLEILVIRKKLSGEKSVVKIAWEKNPAKLRIENFPGDVQLVAREVNINDNGVPIRSNSITAKILEDTISNSRLVSENRISEHKLRSAIQPTSTGVLTLHNPWITPGNAKNSEQDKWFPTPVWEGATSLYNERPDYYDDPLQYLLDCVGELIKKGFIFVTWHDILNGSVDFSRHNILLQFDIDAGINSFSRVSEVLRSTGICATGMIHWEAKHWYTYKLSRKDLAVYKALEDEGWAFGYHNNTLTNLVGYNANRATDSDLISKASLKIIDDVGNLREHLNIRTMTHHGGNVLNHQVPIPRELDLVCVDRKFSPRLWQHVDRSFSDGGFTSRPTDLTSYVDTASSSDTLLFMRCHPFKYGNYPEGEDIEKLESSHPAQIDFPSLEKKINNSSNLTSIQKQAAWLSSRSKTRSGVQLGYASAQKPLSSKFLYTPEILLNIDELRARRRPEFLRQYPCADGDPRVIWLHVLSTFCKIGRVLNVNVGAKLQGQEDETICFLSAKCELIELDIDITREPDIIADFCSSNINIRQEFSQILLNGLSHFSIPDIAISNAAKFLRPCGKLLIAAVAASHPERGGMFRPNDRPIWRLAKLETQGESLSHTTLLWSFDKQSIEQLMRAWPGKWEAEFISDYWFIVATKFKNGKN